MNTTTISEADVIGFLKHMRAALCVPEWAHCGVNINPGDAGGGASFSIFGHMIQDNKVVWVDGCGPTPDQAAANFAAKLPPTGAALAAKKRADAAKLLAEADAIAPEPIAKPAAVELDPCEDAA